MKGFYVVGLGPGDPELITVKAKKILEASDIVFVPQSRRKKDSLARRICKYWVDEEKLETVFFAMKACGADKEGYKTLAQRIKLLLQNGKLISYVTIGDPAIYSTAIYLCKQLKEYGIKITYIPGVSAFNAGAAVLGLALCAKGENFGLYEMPDDDQLAAELIKKHDTTIFMKVNRRVPALLKALKISSPRKAFLLEKIGLPEEKVYDLLCVSEPLEEAYLSLAIIRK